MFTTASGNPRPGFRNNRLLWFLLAAFCVVWVLAAIEPLYPDDWLLENVLVFASVPVLILTYKRFPFSDLSYVLLTAFMILHSVGTHYTYAEVPFGFWLQEQFNLSRNHYDRIVHCSFGLLLAYPMRELIQRSARVVGFWLFFLPITMTLGMSAMYEVAEWFAAAVTNPELGTAYLGTQGDEWDAQKDTGLAAVGAIVAMVITRIPGKSARK